LRNGRAFLVTLIIRGGFVHELALFAGAGGGILGGKLLGWRTVCAVEWEPYPASVLAARQNDKVLETFPIWDDVQTFDGKPWRGIVDVVSGGFPCQDISAAGKGAGIDGERSGMWGEMARIIHEVRPRYVFVENSPMLTSRGLGRVLGDLASMGFNARWGVLGAADVGANHQRDRIWIVGKQISDTKGTRTWENNNWVWEGISGIGGGQNTENAEVVARWDDNISHSKHIGTGRRKQQQESVKEKIINTSSKNVERQRSITIGIESEFGNISDASWWQSEPNVGRVANGVAARVDRLKAIGNGQVPLCAATAWRILSA
jgi:DNA (cytosine-5)-methyltransferase 1